jgi:hypothetical protein
MTIQAGITFIFSASATDIEKVNTKDIHTVFGNFNNSSHTIYSLLTKLKKEFKITSEQQKQAVNLTSERFKNSSKAKIYIIDDFKRESLWIGSFFGFPVYVTTIHGTIVKSIIENLTRNLPVEIIPIQENLSHDQEVQLGKDKFNKKFHLLKALEKIEREKGFIVINLSLGMKNKGIASHDDYFSLTQELINLNNKGIIVFQAAGNQNNRNILDLDLDKAVGLVLNNVYTIGGIKKFQSGEINADSNISVTYKNKVVSLVSGTSFSCPKALGKFIQTLYSSK